MIPLRRLLGITATVTVLLLAAVLALAVAQQRMTRAHARVIEREAQVVFRFGTLRDHLTGAMLAGRWEAFDGAGRELEAMHRDLMALLEHALVPASFRLGLAGGVDVQGIALLARKLADGGGARDRATALELAEAMRVMADQLLRLDRVLTARMNEQLIRFQNSVIGALTLITGLIGLLLTVLYRQGLRPLLVLAARLRAGEDPADLVPPPGACPEIREIAARLTPGAALADMPGSGALGEIANLLNGIINYAQVLMDECERQAGDAEHAAMLQRIVEHGERISGLLLAGGPGAVQPGARDGAAGPVPQGRPQPQNI